MAVCGSGPHSKVHFTTLLPFCNCLHGGIEILVVFLASIFCLFMCPCKTNPIVKTTQARSQISLNLAVTLIEIGEENRLDEIKAAVSRRHGGATPPPKQHNSNTPQRDDAGDDAPFFS